MNQREVGRLGGLATKTKYGASHFSAIGKLGGRPPIPIIPENGAPGNNYKKGGNLPTGDYRELLKLWESHPLNPLSRS